MWVRREDVGNGRTYFGAQRSTVANLSDSATNGNPYFYAPIVSQLPQMENNWLLWVYHIHPHTYSSTSKHPDSGIYDINGNKVTSAGTDYKWLPTTTVSGIRSYLFYSTSVNEKQFRYEPRFEVVDTAPSVDQLITGVGDKPETLDYDVTTNGNYTFSTTDQAGNTRSASISVANIDTVAPPVPTMVAEPSVTAGTTNNVSANAVTDAGV